MPPEPVPLPLAESDEVATRLITEPAVRLILPPLPLVPGFTSITAGFIVKLLPALLAVTVTCPPLLPVAFIATTAADPRTMLLLLLRVTLPPFPVDPIGALALSVIEPEPEFVFVILLALIESTPPLPCEPVPSAPMVMAPPEFVIV